MITIPTRDLTGILGDVVPFACPSDEFPSIHCVRLEWDGNLLHALATDRYRVGISTWQPGEVLPDEEVQDDLFTNWGSGDEPWASRIALPDAVELVKVFKLPPKQGWTPVTVDYEADRYRLTVKRSRDTGHSAITIAVQDDSLDNPFPNVRALLADATKFRAPKEITYSAKYLADFAKVRPAGPLELRFTERLTHVKIGGRFVGAIMPLGKDEA